MSGASGRSSVSVGTRSRIAVVTARVASLASSGARRSSACVAHSASIATTVRELSIARRSFSPASHPMLTWSSVVPEVGIESTLAGTARRLHCDTIDACVYCASMKPEFTPGSGTRNAGNPFECAGSSMRSVRRSLIEAISDAAIARKSSANAIGSPWKLPALSTVPSSCKTMGLSTSLESSASVTRIA